MNDELRKQYYPFTDTCPIDGQPCISNKCKFWVTDRVCWYHEFGSLVEETFNCNRHDYIFYDLDEDHYLGRFCLHINMWPNDREDFNVPPKIVVEIGVNSKRLAEKLKEKFDLISWDIQSRTEDGGDDHDLVFITHASYLEKDTVVNLLKKIKELILKMVEAEKEINTCNLCKEHCSSLTKYGDYDICFNCERRIILENLPNYFKN